MTGRGHSTGSSVPPGITEWRAGREALCRQCIVACRAFLKRGPRKAAEIEEAAVIAGITRRTLNRAKRGLCVNSSQKCREWCWRLPDCQISIRMAGNLRRVTVPSTGCEIPASWQPEGRYGEPISAFSTHPRARYRRMVIDLRQRRRSGAVSGYQQGCLRGPPAHYACCASTPAPADCASPTAPSGTGGGDEGHRC